MNHPPSFPDPSVPSEPHWWRWWLSLLLLWGLQVAVLLAILPEGRSRLEWWLWSAVLPFCWALVLMLRVLVWQIGLFNCQVHRRIQYAASQRWWGRRSLGLPVQQVLLLGPAGDVQTHYQGLMANASVPQALTPQNATQPMLRCPLSLSGTGERASALARHLARLTLALPELNERWPQLRGIAWLGEESHQTSFVEMLAKSGVALPEARLPLQDLPDLDHLIDAFNQDCRDAADWLLCAGVVSTQSAEEGELPGEAGFLWLVSRQGRKLLHRGEYLLSERGETAAELCAQVQGYASLNCAPPTCLALDEVSQKAFVEGDWSAAEHQLAEHWGALAQMAPFIGMSLALLQAGEAGQPCGWLSSDADKRLAIGMAVPYGND